jgi:hypothetical protein
MLPDLEMLRRLLDSGRLGCADLREVRRLHDELASRHIARLERPNRVWAERLFYEHRLGRQRPDALGVPLGRQTTVNRSELVAGAVAAFDAMPRPKKPPGRA